MKNYRAIFKNPRIFDIDFVILLIYSLLPGIYKILGNQLLMLFSFPVIVYFFISDCKKIKIYKADIFYILFFSYIVVQALVYLICPGGYVNKTGILMGLFLDIMPMAGFFISREIDYEKLSIQLVYIIAIHAFIGIILYPGFHIVDFNNPTVHILKEGVAALRMASVSGSLPFGNLVLIGLVLAFHNNRKYFLLLFLFCAIFSMQRSAWFGSGLVFFLYSIMVFIKGDYKKLLKIFFYSILVMFIFYLFLFKISNISLIFLFGRIGDIGHASSERSDQWVNGISNFVNNPIGTGVGQVGHVAARYEKSFFLAVPDGDFFRMISEYGISALLLLCMTGTISLLLLFLKKLKKNEMCVLTVILCCAFQMIGSNITEFFFNNFIFWLFLGKMIFIFKTRFFNISRESITTL